MTDRVRRRLGGRRALVTGASRGIGAAVAERLAAEGADVAITARTLDAHDHLPGALTATAERLVRYGATGAMVVADLTDEVDRARIVPEAVEGLGGPLDILVNNAAAAIYQPVAEMLAKRRRLMFEANVQAPLDLAQAVIPDMRAAGAGWIVNVSSRAARPWDGPPFELGANGTAIAAYGASKAALNRITNGLAAELHGTGIRVNTVEPRAAVRTEGADALVGSSVPSDKWESLEEMVEATVALCDCPEDVTGQAFVSLDLIADWGLTVHGLDGSRDDPEHRYLNESTGIVDRVTDQQPVDELMGSLQRLGRLLASRQVASRIATAAGVDVTQQGAALLRVLLREGQQPIAMLAASVPMDLGAASRQVRVLEDAGLVRRTRSPSDGRVALLALTADGRRVAERIRSVGVRHLEEALRGWSDVEERTLAHLMQRLVDDLVATPVPPGATRPRVRQT